MKRSAADTTMKTIGFGILVTCGVALAISGLVGGLVLKEIMPISVSPLIAMLLNGVNIFAVCYVSVRKCVKSRLPFALIMAAAFSAIGFLMKASFFPRTAFSFGWYSAIPFLSAAIAGVMASKKKRVRRQ